MVRVKHLRRSAASALACAWLCAALAGCGDLGIKDEARALVEAAASTWTTEIVSSEGTVPGKYTAALSLNGTEPRIAFIRYDVTRGIWYATRSGSSWSRQQVYNHPSMGMLAFDLSNEGNPFIAWDTSSSYSLHLSYWKETQWTYVTPDNTFSSQINRMDLVADNVGSINPPYHGLICGYGLGNNTYFVLEHSARAEYTALRDRSNVKMQSDSIGVLSYAYQSGNNVYFCSPTQSEVPAAYAQTLVGHDFVLDSSGGLHIAYNDNNEISYVSSNTANSGAWSTAETVALSESGYFALCTYKANSGKTLPCIAYSSGGSSSHLYFAYKTDSGSWVNESVDSSSTIGYSVSLAVDSLGRAHIVYHDSVNKNLKYALRKPL